MRLECHDPKFAEPRDMPEILISRQQLDVIFDTQSGDQRINCTRLYAVAAAVIAEIRRRDMRFAGRRKQRNVGKPLNQLFGSFRPVETLQKFLQHLMCSKVLP